MAVRRRESGPLERAARTTLRDAGRAMARLERECSEAVAAAAETLIACLENGGTVYFCGNGGSAADAQHLAAELQGRYYLDRPALAAVALTVNTSSLTAIGNDYGYAQVFSRQLEGLGAPGDVLVAITTSGGSESIRRCVHVAQKLGMTVVGLTGEKGGEFAASCDVALVTPSAITPRIQEGHIAMGHTVCELVERALFPPPPSAPAKPKRPARARRAATPRGGRKRTRGASR